MEVKVIKASLQTYWYAKEIGEVFEVVPCSIEDFDYKVVKPGLPSYLKAIDCIMLNNEKMNLPTNAVPVLMEKPEEKVKPVYLDEISNSDHIGFITNGFGKGYIVRYKDSWCGIYLVSANPNCSLGNGIHTSQVDVLENHNASCDIISIFKFATRRDLYAWLAED